MSRCSGMRPADLELLLQAEPAVRLAPQPRAGRALPRRLVAAAGAFAACAAGAALLALARRRAAAKAAALGGAVSLYEGSCVDTPGWTNGQPECHYQVLGNDTELCTSTGWTCDGYVAKGLCGGEGGPKAFALGPGLNSPEKNCCACKGFKMKNSCDKETGGTCHMTGSCSGWRGAATCEGGKCVCPDGYCHGGAGTCQLDIRSAWMRSKRGEPEPGLVPQCQRDTGGKCLWFGNCDDYRGNVSCKLGMPPRCFCSEGYCVDHSGACFRAVGMVKAQVARVSRTHPQFPGQQGTIKTALCVSGGGSRSMSAALGLFRALARLGLLPKIDVISSVSGGSWASSILMFAPMDLDKLLGLDRSLAPDTLTLNELDKEPPPFGAVLMNPTVSTAFKLKMKKVPFRLLWIETIGKVILEPFGLNNKHAYMALNQSEVSRIVSKNPQLQDAAWHVVQSGRARNIIINGCLAAPSGFKASADNAVSFQASPDFTGSPFYPNDGPVDYENSQLGRAGLTRVLVGGGLVETFAFGATHPAKRADQRGGDSIQLLAPTAPFSLARAVGISSAAFAGQASTMVGAGANVNPQVPIWPVTSPEHPRPQVAMQNMVGDGGNLENTGLLAALQRGASKVVVMINSDSATSTTAGFCDSSPSFDPKGQITSQFAQLFGFCQASSSMVYNTHNQVFRSEDFWPTACQLQRLKSHGKAQISRSTLVVQPNLWWGIQGGGSVDVIFNLLDTANEFQEQLPSDTQQALSSGPIGGLSNFPAYKTVFNNLNDMTELTARQINLLAAQTDWAAMQNRSAFQSIFGTAFR